MFTFGNCTAMDLKEDRKERQEQIDAALGNSKITSQDGVDLYDKWSEYYEQVRYKQIQDNT